MAATTTQIVFGLFELQSLKIGIEKTIYAWLL